MIEIYSYSYLGELIFSEEYLLSTPNNTYDLLSVFIVYSINLVYSIVIIQFIFSKINNTSINLNLITISALRITGLYIIIFMPSILISISFFSFIPAADILLLAIPVSYLITFFSQYLIISQQKNIVESIILSYKIVKQHLSNMNQISEQPTQNNRQNIQQNNPTRRRR